MNARPLVLLHGFLGCAEDWDEVRAEIEPGIPCVALDLPGHGAQPPPRPEAGFAGGVEHVRSELARRGIERCHLLGYSMGGRLCLWLSARHPELVASAVAVGASAGIEGEEERRRRRDADRALAEQLERGDFALFLDRWYGQALFAPLRQSPRFQAVLQRRLQGRPAALAKALLAFGTGAQPWLGPELAAAKVRILLLAGALDAKYVAGNARLASRVTGCESRTVGGSGHSPHLENPPELARLVRDFVAGEPPQEPQR